MTMMIMTLLRSKVTATHRLIDKLYDYLGEQPLLNKMLRTHHVDIHQSLEELKQSVRELKPKQAPVTLWQQEFYNQVNALRSKVKRALKTARALEQDPEDSAVKDYLFFLLWNSIDRVEFMEQGVKNFEEYVSQTNLLKEKKEKDHG